MSKLHIVYKEEDGYNPRTITFEIEDPECIAEYIEAYVSVLKAITFHDVTIREGLEVAISQLDDAIGLSKEHMQEMREELKEKLAAEAEYAGRVRSELAEKPRKKSKSKKNTED